MEIKVCGMRERTNCLHLVEEVAPDWMGLIFYPPSPRVVSEEDAAWIKELPLKKVGVFVGEKETAILRKSYLFGLSALQLHGGESLDEIQRLQELAELKIWKVIPVGGEIDWKAWEAFVPYVDRFLFDTDTKSKGGSGKTFDWKLLESYPFETGFVLGGGLTLAHADELVALSQKFPQLLGVDVNSGFEFAPGVKKIADLKAFKEKLKS
ncbi:MAG: phosphoribosylanthranilate isomerase [Bacteroidetes bacterium]|nr:phosphoribosylanthranilate isomerase [Bacteroidota bacterium]